MDLVGIWTGRRNSNVWVTADYFRRHTPYWDDKRGATHVLYLVGLPMKGCKSAPFAPLIVAVHCAVLVTAGLASCTQEASTQTFSIDGNQFVVPKEYLLPSQLEWFKERKPEGGFIFTNDPKLPVTEQFTVALTPRESTCRPDKVAASPLLADACSGEHQAQQFSGVGELRKELTFPGNDTFWAYTVKGPGATRTVVATCYAAASSKANDSCSAFGWYSSSIYSFYIKDRNIAHLSQRRAEIESLLSSWERR